MTLLSCNISVFAGYFFGNFTDKASIIYSTDKQPVVGFSVIPKCMTLNDPEWLFQIKLFLHRGMSGVQPCDFRK